MTPAVPVIDVEAAEAGDRAQLDAVRIATEEFGAVQVINHGVPQGRVADLSARAGRLLSRPRAERRCWPARTRTGAGGSGRMTSGGSSSSASTWPSSTTSTRPGRRAWQEGRPYVAELAAGE
jgi:isopenicillin N synthase-like dioxygenase